jgi:signal transduction histidine kinase
MPRMNGIEMVQAIHDIKPEQFILVTSAQDEGDKLIELMNAGADMFMAKPIVYQQFLTNLYKISKKIVDAAELEKLRHINDRQSAINDLLHNIAHHWRQPLNVLSLLNEDNLDELEFNNINNEELKNNFQTSNQIIQSLSTTINQFSTLLVDDTQKDHLNINQSVLESVELIKVVCQEHNINIEINHMDELIIDGYKNQLSTVIINLLTNAQESLTLSSHERKTISIDLQKDDHYCTMIISDNGDGIAHDVIDKIFEPYFSTKGIDAGKGVGLYISKSIIESCFNGTLKIESDAKTVTRATIRLPLN